MENQSQPQKIEMPSILTANTLYWNSASGASNRRRNESRRQEEVYDFFKALGFDVEYAGDHVRGELGGISFDFYYSESCQNVYKSFTVYRDGKKSNISQIKKLLK